MNALPQIILIVLAFIVPSGLAVAVFSATQDPWQALGIFVVVAIVEAILGFITKVWQKLEPKWVERLADWIDSSILSSLSGYRRQYLDHIIFQHRAFDVKGLTTQGTYTLELERVFVQLSVDTAPAHQASADPILSLPEELRRGSHAMWAYLNSPQMKTQNLAVLGAPGSGKTTLLKHMALTLASGRLHRRREGAPAKLPILLFLRDHASAINSDPDLPLVQMVCDQLKKWQAPLPPAGWLEGNLARGNCMVMLDGLDEVADLETRKSVVAWVEKCMTAHGQNRFILTSRPHGYHTNPLMGVTTLRVLPFTHTQIVTFVQNWYLANEIMSFQKDDAGVRATARQGAEDLLKRIRSSAPLSALAVNPLLLTMIANVHRYRSSLPGRRVELYAEICEVFLGKRQQARDLTLDLTPAQKQRVLQPLACYLMVRAQREIAVAEAIKVIAEDLKRVSPQYSAEAFLKMIENSSGLLVEREGGVYSFAHLTFQEYLAAIYIRENRLETKTLIPQVNNGWWHETIRLYCAVADASPIISACLSGERPSTTALVLAMECIEEAREVRPDVRAQYEKVITQGLEDPDPERRRVVAEARLALRTRRYDSH